MENIKFKERKAFNFYRSYYETSLLLDGKDKAEFLECIINYQFTGILIEPKRKNSLLAFRGQIHSINKQIIGFDKGKDTYPNGYPTEGKDKGKGKGSHKEVQDKDKEKEEVQVKEKEENDIPPTAFSMYRSLLDLGAEKQLINDWLKVRKTKKATNTKTALYGFISQVEKSNKDLNSILKICIENSWSGFKVSWLENLPKSESKIIPGETHEEKIRREYVERMTGKNKY